MSEIGSGTLLAGKYRLESLIGRGGMGSVWRAEHLGLNAPVAVKLLDMLHFDGASDALNRFHREARSAAAIRSPHVVQIFDHGVDPTFGVPFIVMELMEGESLANRLARSGRIPPAEIGRVFTHVARALSRAHEAGIVHRDLKPDNVFLVRNEDEEVAKVLDFGIAKAQAHGLGQDSNTRTGAIMGTAYYMSPEQISGNKNVDYRTDLWALGVMACECMTGQRPFEADTIGGITLKICIEPVPLPSSLAPVPTGFDQWFARIVNRDPNQRFSSAREAADTLRKLCMTESGAQRLAQPVTDSSGAFQATVATTAAPLTSSSRPHSDTTPPKRKSAAPWFLGGVALVTALAGALWFRAGGKTEATLEALPSAGPAAAAAGATPPAVPPAVSEARPSQPPPPSAEPSAAAIASAVPEAPAAPQARAAKGAAPRSKDRPSAASPNAVATTTPPAAPAVAPAKPAEAPKAAPAVRDLLDSR
jgi:eukaryotic-like serine/threonine-protein kinase